MPYNEATVVLGGLLHIPIIIVVLRFVESRRKDAQANYQ